MELGDMDLDVLEATFLDKNPNRIPPQQVSLLEKALNIQAKKSNSLGVVVESLKSMDGNKNKK